MRFLLFLIVFLCIKISIYTNNIFFYWLSSIFITLYAGYHIIKVFKVLNISNAKIDFFTNKNHAILYSFLYLFLLISIFIVVSIYWYRIDFIKTMFS